MLSYGDTDRQTNEQIDTRTYKERETNAQTDRHTDIERQADRQTNTQIDRHTFTIGYHDLLLGVLLQGVSAGGPRMAFIESRLFTIGNS